MMNESLIDGVARILGYGCMAFLFIIFLAFIIPHIDELFGRIKRNKVARLKRKNKELSNNLRTLGKKYKELKNANS